MATGPRRTARRRALARRRRQGRAALGAVRWDGVVLGLLALASLLVGGLFQDPVAYGWVAGAAAALLLVRLALPQDQLAAAAEAGTAPLRKGGWKGLLRDGLTLLLHASVLAVITFAIAGAIPLDRGATSLGNQALLIAAAWGFYGLMLVLTAPLVPRALPWLPLGQAVFTCAMGLLLIGGLMAQGRWADPWTRYLAYGGVPGAILLAVYVRAWRGQFGEIDRLLALAALILGFGIASFEATRWLEPVLTYPMGTTVTPQILARGQNLVNGLSLVLWTLYALVVHGVGLRLRSRTLRSLGEILGASAGIYLLLSLLLLAIR